MKKAISLRLFLIIMTVTLCTVVFNAFIRIDIAKKTHDKYSHLKIEQIRETLNYNNYNLSLLKESQKEDSLIRAKAAAYIIQKHPEFITDIEELKKIALLLQIDELHIFSDEGVIYAGTNPEYYGYNFSSGEQIAFFAPLLEDKSLSLCQDIAPNTAENKYMQYSAVWQEDGKNIIQIGIDPERILNEQKLTQLSYLFSVISNNTGELYFAIEKKTDVVSGCTDPALSGKQAASVGFFMDNLIPQVGFFTNIQGRPYYCFFEEYGDLLIGITIEKRVLYESVYTNIVSIAVYLIISALIMLCVIFVFIDRYVIRGIDTIIKDLAMITDGNLDVKVDVSNSPEFRKLSFHINRMVTSLLNNTERLSQIFDMANVMIGVYEYNTNMERVRATKKIQTLLMLQDNTYTKLLADKKAFNRYMETILANPYDAAHNVYKVADCPPVYLRILPFSDEKNTVCIVSDVTAEILEKQRIEHDRDYDVLTGIYNRRAFYTKLDRLFSGSPSSLTDSVLIILDMDGLKFLNDTYGHINGDIAIKAAADVFISCEIERCIHARLGGDEFVVFIYGYSKSELEEYIRKLHDKMIHTSVTLTNGVIHPVRISGGYVFYPEYDCSFRDLLGLADEALYHAKNTQKGTFVEYKKTAFDDIPKL